MVHYHDHIVNFGSPNGLCLSITESKHITAVKRPWRQSNKHSPLSQMLKSNERMDKLAAARVDFMVRSMLLDSCLIQAIKTALGAVDDEDPMEDVESETDSDISTEPEDPGAGHTGVQDFDGVALNFRDSGLEDAVADADTHVPDADDHPHHHPPTPTLLDEDDDCGPIESGPLMNEVRFTSKKGTFHSSAFGQHNF